MDQPTSEARAVYRGLWGKTLGTLQDTKPHDSAINVLNFRIKSIKKKEKEIHIFVFVWIKMKTRIHAFIR